MPVDSLDETTCLFEIPSLVICRLRVTWTMTRQSYLEQISVNFGLSIRMLGHDKGREETWLGSRAGIQQEKQRSDSRRSLGPASATWDFQHIGITSGPKKAAEKGFHLGKLFHKGYGIIGESLWPEHVRKGVLNLWEIFHVRGLHSSRMKLDLC